jgi:hypothetical protein
MTVRLRVLLQRARLDRELADGLRADSSPLRRRRAEQLVSERCRRELADALERAIRDSHRPRPVFTAAATLQAREIRAARPVLEALIRRLRDDLPVRVRGVALVRVLLTDGASPLYHPHPAGALRAWADTALRALRPPTHHFALPA